MWFAAVFCLERKSSSTSAESAPTVRSLLYLSSIPIVVIAVRTLAGWKWANGLPWRILLGVAGLAFGVFVVSATSDILRLTDLSAALKKHVLRRTSRWQRTGMAVTVAALLVSALLATFRVVRDFREPTLARESFLRWYVSQPTTQSSLLNDASGNSTVLVIFQDYQCPPCRRAFEEYQPVITRLAQKYPGRLKTQFKDYPLDARCNNHVRLSLHPLACVAAAASRLARDRGKNHDQFEKWLYQNQASLSEDAIWDVAKSLAGVEHSEAMVEEAFAAIRSDANAGHELKVMSTPTIFVDGVKMDGFVSADWLQAVLEHAIRRLPGMNRTR